MRVDLCTLVWAGAAGNGHGPTLAENRPTIDLRESSGSSPGRDESFGLVWRPYFDDPGRREAAGISYWDEQRHSQGLRPLSRLAKNLVSGL